MLNEKGLVLPSAVPKENAGFAAEPDVGAVVVDATAFLTGGAAASPVATGAPVAAFPPPNENFDLPAFCAARSAMLSFWLPPTPAAAVASADSFAASAFAAAAASRIAASFSGDAALSSGAAFDRACAS